MNICVFGAASDAIDREYIELGEALGRAMADRGHTLIFGGGQTGLMGAVVRGAHEHHGEILGVAPRFFDVPGILFLQCTEFVYTDTMAERKSIMEERADAFLALPGGVGTMEEVLEVITLRNLGRMCKPIAFLEAKDYWEPLCRALDAAVDKGFAEPSMKDTYARFTSADACLDYLERKE